MNLKIFIINLFVGLLEIIRDIADTFTTVGLSTIGAVVAIVSPIPVAVMTSESASDFLGLTGTVAGVLAFSIECIGLMATTILVITFVEAIKTKNKQAWFVSGFLALVEIAYLTILINLNVSLEQANSGKDVRTVITLICLLPMLSGFLYGYWNVYLKTEKKKISMEELEEQRYQQRQDELNARWRLKHGYALDVQNSVKSVQEDVSPMQEIELSGDWRVDEGKMMKKQLLWLKDADINVICKECGLSRRTAYNWKEKAIEKLGE